MQTVTTSVYLQWHQWSLWRGLSKAVVLAFREVKEAPPQCVLDFLQSVQKTRWFSGKFFISLVLSPVFVLGCSSSLNQVAPQPARLSPVTSWCHVYLCLAVCLCKFMLSPSLHPLLFWRLVSNVANCCLFSFPCPTYYLGWVRSPRCLGLVWVFLPRSSSRCLLLFTLSFCIWVPLMVFLPPQWSVETKPECSAWRDLLQPHSSDIERETKTAIFWCMNHNVDIFSWRMTFCSLTLFPNI